MVDHFQQLGLDAATATHAVVRDTYRNLIRSAHPDKAEGSAGLASSLIAAWNALKTPAGFEAHRREVLARRAFLAASEGPQLAPGAPQMPDSELPPGFFPSYVAQAFRDALDAAERRETNALGPLLRRHVGRLFGFAPAPAPLRHMPYRILLEVDGSRATLRLFYATALGWGRNLIAVPRLSWNSVDGSAGYSQTRANVIVRDVECDGVPVVKLSPDEIGLPDGAVATLVFDAP